MLLFVNTSTIASQLAAQRVGVVSRPELRRSGLTDRQVTGLVQRGELVVAHRGVFRVAGVADSLEARCAAACLAAGDGSAVDRETAAILHGLRSCQAGDGADRSAGPVCVAVPAHRRVQLRGVDVAYRAALPPSDTQRMTGFRLTTPTRTLIDCAAFLSPRELGFMVDEALRRRLTALPILRRRVVELGRAGRRGAGVIAEVLAERDGEIRGSNTFERDVRRSLRKAGLPKPVMQHCVILLDGSERYLDLAYPIDRVGIEAVSWMWHAQHSDWVADQERNNALAAVGWRMIGVTWQQRRDRPETIAAAVAAAIGTDIHGRAAG